MSEINLDGGSVIVGGMGVVDISKPNEPQGDFVTLTIRQFAHQGVRSETSATLTPSQARLLAGDLEYRARQMEAGEKIETLEHDRFNTYADWIRSRLPADVAQEFEMIVESYRAMARRQAA